MPAAVHARVALRQGGVAVLIDLADGGMPAVVHWGADLGELTAADAAELVAATQAWGVNNGVDYPVATGILPQGWTGWTGRPGISGSRAGRDWSPLFRAVAVRVDGTEATGAGTTESPDLLIGTQLEVDLRDDAARLDLTVTVELTPSGVLRSRATLTNTAAETYQLNDLVLAYPLPERAQEILDFAGRWSKERTPQRRPLNIGTHLREGRHGRTGADAATVLHVGTPGFGFADGEIWGVHTGWSGNHTHYAERVLTGEQVVGGGELLLPGEVELGEGESYTSPWLYGSYGRGLDEVARRFHRFVRARESYVDTQRPVTLNVWEAVYFDHRLDKLTELADLAANVGVERFVLDDGWFGARRNDYAGLGDWTVSRDVWPDGLHPLIDHVTGLGMQFGLWFEPEMINADSDVARAHPEWIMATGDRLPVESRHQQVINLGIPECYAFIRDSIDALLNEYAISYIKWDHNRDLVDAGTAPTGRPGVHEQTEAFYRLVDELKAAHPGLEIESCSSGGARVDLGVLERTDRVWVSDCIDPLERLQMNRWTTQLVPPELMGSHIASGHSHTTGRQHSLDFRAASAIFGHLGIEWDLTQASQEDLTELADWIGFYKAHRDLLFTGDVVRIDHPDESVYVHGVLAPSRDRAIFTIAQAGRSEVSGIGRIALTGLDPDRRYRLRPALVGRLPEGLRPPTWYRPTDVQYSPFGMPSGFSDAEGIVLSGRALAAVGVRSPDLNPEHAVILVAEAVTEEAV